MTKKITAKNTSTTRKTGSTFSAESIVQIIKACSDSGVGYFELDSLKIQMLDKTDKIHHTLDSEIFKIEYPENDQGLVGDDASHLKEEVLAEDDLEILRLSDPATWERQLRAENSEALHIGTEPTL